MVTYFSYLDKKKRIYKIFSESSRVKIKLYNDCYDTMLMDIMTLAPMITWAFITCPPL